MGGLLNFETYLSVCWKQNIILQFKRHLLYVRMAIFVSGWGGKSVVTVQGLTSGYMHMWLRKKVFALSNELEKVN